MIFDLHLGSDRKLNILIYFFLFGSMMPVLSFWFLLKYKIIDSIEMETQKERTIPIIVMFFYCLLVFGRFYADSLEINFYPKYLVTLPFAGVVVTFVFFFLNRWKKISIHAAGCGILVGFLFSYINGHSDYQVWILALAFVISGLVMSSRLYLKKHSLEELVIGWGIGTFVTFGVDFLF